MIEIGRYHVTPQNQQITCQSRDLISHLPGNRLDTGPGSVASNSASQGPSLMSPILRCTVASTRPVGHNLPFSSHVKTTTLPYRTIDALYTIPLLRSPIPG